METSKLSTYDFIFLIDKSGSMGMPGTSGKTRWEEAQETTFALALKAEKFDDNGIDVVVFGSNCKLYENVTSAKVSQVFAENEPSGSTNTAGALKLVLDRYTSNPVKPIIVVVLTDGEPDSRDELKKVIRDFAETLSPNESGTDTDQAGIMFLQVGNDPKATEFLIELDDNLGAKFDIVDAKTIKDTENMPLADFLLQALED